MTPSEAMAAIYEARGRLLEAGSARSAAAGREAEARLGLRRALAAHAVTLRGQGDEVARMLPFAAIALCRRRETP